MADFHSVPIVDVHKHNLKSLLPSINLAIKSSTFIAMDAELSGLGNRRNLMSRSMEDRYNSLADVARTRSILSLGMSCFSSRVPLARSEAKQSYLVQTFNITMLCSEDYVVEPGSLQFLVDHGFDFNKQYKAGIPYHRGADKEETLEDDEALRALFVELVLSNKPVVFHNGLVDLVFLYHNLYADLPAKSASFIADLCEVFPGGIFDTKYVAEFGARMPASYLEYVFRKSQRNNARRSYHDDENHVAVEFCQYQDSPHVEFHNCRLPASFTSGDVESPVVTETPELCQTYAAHGHCKDGIRCTLSHDQDAIQDVDDRSDERKKQRKKRRHHKQYTETDLIDVKKHKPDASRDRIDDECRNMLPDIPEETITQDQSNDVPPTNGKSGDILPGPAVPAKPLGCHRAGYDAFMTGFAMAVMACQLSAKQSGQQQPHSEPGGFVEEFRLSEFQNRLFLSGKPIPLLIAKSGFTKTSPGHREKIKRLASQ